MDTVQMRNLSANSFHKDVAWLGVSKVASLLSTLAVLGIAANALPMRQYGKLIVLQSLIVAISAIACLGQDKLIVQKLATPDYHKSLNLSRVLGKKTFKIVIVVSVAAVACAYMLLREITSSGINIGSLMLITAAIVWVITATVQRQIAEGLKGLLKIRSYVMLAAYPSVGLAVSILTPVTYGVLLVIQAATLTTFVVASAAISTLCALLALREYICATKPVELTPHPIPGALSTIGLIGEGLPLAGASILFTLSNQCLIWIAAATTSAADVALLHVAQKLALLSIAPMLVINTAVAPRVANAYFRAAFGSAASIIKLAATSSAAGCLAIAIPLVMLGKYGIGVYFGPQYERAYGVMLVLLVGFTANAVVGPWEVVLPMTGQRKSLLLTRALGLLIVVPASLLFGDAMGIVGIAIAFTLCECVSSVVGRYAVIRTTGIKTQASIVLPNDIRRFARSLKSFIAKI